ncbi:MAG: NADH:ubiquinone reductase (Na(+)-transporting) subunit C [Bacteroidetes bacterium]|jgi:Na+-transporting NADH:ubiquinone oxidoreductase subunit C|nr:NADH:ubiquinone reductase (Na(+)-transporting) subunit C [Bacteroidota bacterium]
MKNFSNRYIFVFSFIMVVIVASLLALAATLLQPAQERNLEIAKKRSMLESIGVISTKDNSVELYDRYITESFVLNIQGEVIEDVDAFNVVLRNEQRKPPEDQHLPVFRAFPDDGEKVVILPVEGKGLWGPIYGYVSLRSDLNTIYGVTFDHDKETPGLGAEINTTGFESMFTGKKLYQDDRFVSVQVLKGGADPSDQHGVDAISGGTITSKALEEMLSDCLKKYDAYLTQNRN